MKIKQYHTIESYLADNLSFLEQDEASNNLLIGLPLALSQQKDVDPYPLLLSVSEGDKIVLSGIQTPPRNLLISGLEAYSDRAIKALISYLMQQNIQFPGVIGTKDLAISFAENWKKSTSYSWETTFKQMVYRLDKVNNIPISKGFLRKAILQDLDTIEVWSRAFSAEAMNNEGFDEARENSKRKIESGKLYVWEDGQIVSMAAVARPTRNGITINYVYSPPAFRGKGYASSCVAKVSELMLKEYQFCSLYTDLSNPTSNSIYQKIGYRPLAESRVISFNMNHF